MSNSTFFFFPLFSQHNLIDYLNLTDQMGSVIHYRSNNKQRDNYNFSAAAKAVSVKGRLNGCHNECHIYNEKRHSFAVTELLCRGTNFKMCFFGWLAGLGSIMDTKNTQPSKRPGGFLNDVLSNLYNGLESQNCHYSLCDNMQPGD